MPRRISIKQWTQDGRDWFWKSLCLVYDNEALGFMERLLETAGIEFKVTEA